MRRSIVVLAVSFLLAVCSDATGPDDGGNVAIRFAVARGASTASSAASFSVAPTPAAQSVPVEGRNGTLLFDRIVLLVDEVELRGEGAACEGAGPKLRDDDEGDDDDDDDGDRGRRHHCRLAADGFIFDLPVDGSGITVASDLIPNGIYDELKFRLKSVRLDDRENQRVVDLLTAELLGRFPEWPSRASVLLEGSFDPAGDGAPRPFRVFLDADLDIRMALEPPLEITDAGPSRVITVEVHPELWFRRFDGSVVDLSQLDFAKTNRIIRVDLFPSGFRRGHRG
jgi:hypothetical protein